MASFPPAVHDLLNLEALLTPEEKALQKRIRAYMVRGRRRTLMKEGEKEGLPHAVCSLTQDARSMDQALTTKEGCGGTAYLRPRLRLCLQEANVAPVIAGYWERAEFPHALVPSFAALGLAGGPIKGYGCPVGGWVGGVCMRVCVAARKGGAAARQQCPLRCACLGQHRGAHAAPCSAGAELERAHAPAQACTLPHAESILGRRVTASRGAPPPSDALCMFGGGAAARTAMPCPARAARRACR